MVIVKDDEIVLNELENSDIDDSYKRENDESETVDPCYKGQKNGPTENQIYTGDFLIVEGTGNIVRGNGCYIDGNNNECHGDDNQIRGDGNYCTGNNLCII